MSLVLQVSTPAGFGLSSVEAVRALLGLTGECYGVTDHFRPATDEERASIK